MPRTAAPRIFIEDVYPEIDCGRHPVKRELGDTIDVWADVLTEGHGVLQAVVRYAAPGSKTWHSAPMTLRENDRWHGAFTPTALGRWRYTIEAWQDRFGSWAAEVTKKRDAGQDIALELLEGRHLVEEAAPRARGADRQTLKTLLTALDADPAAALEHLTDPSVRRLLAQLPERKSVVRYPVELEVVVDRVAARFAAWYEMVPRSQGDDPDRGSTFAECERRLPEIRDLGFDVVYLTPIHPIGRTNRKGKNNATRAQPGDPGSFYAVGAREGGHDAVHPELGTLDDFRHFVAAARALDMEIALDFAIQCSPDHPWIREHPEWFTFRPDGTIKFAENPPKKYEDIVNVDFDSPDAGALWQALRDVVLFWVEQGVKIFRVDNPHTKPLPFWQWMIGEVQAKHPDVLFLSEAFTRPKLMRALAKAGFSQSYTYFTWRNTKAELTAYLTELAQDWPKDYLRPNFFPSTPDILPPILQSGGRPAFVTRFVLAATLASVYGIYNGFELCEAAALPGREEYADSEKYQYKVWDWDRPGHIKDLIRRVNRIRRENPALHQLKTLRFYPADNDQVLFYGKITQDRTNAVFVAVNLDPHSVQEAHIEMPLAALGLAADRPYGLDDLLLGHSWQWTGPWQHLRLDPASNPVAIFRVRDLAPLAPNP
ncbi:MAG: alpha-1,4-glucan--maltose-1-phosphate maltosyltransferase [Alphaproteobacteria bacterium]|nr:alpha-1,4-glucan--maltose-1-phosphate maltosyltransferase [Alphaproteobacteria bacterium]